MKRLLLGLYAVTVIAIGLAVAQNINRSIQLSQSALGPIGVDSANSVYFPVHMNTAGGAPTINSFGTGGTVSGSDFAGEIGLGTTPGIGGTLTFRTAYTSTPYCNATTRTPTAVGAYATPNGINFSHSLVAGMVINYICIGRSTG